MRVDLYLRVNKKVLGSKIEELQVWIFVFLFAWSFFVYIKSHIELIALVTTNFLEKDFARIFHRISCTFSSSRDQELLGKPFSADDIFQKAEMKQVAWKNSHQSQAINRALYRMPCILGSPWIDTQTGKERLESSTTGKGPGVLVDGRLNMGLFPAQGRGTDCPFCPELGWPLLCCSFGTQSCVLQLCTTRCKNVKLLDGVQRR